MIHPSAYAQEKASLNVGEELKRKIRIAAGGIQTILRMKSLLNLFRYGTLSWQYISHKVLRWTITPLALFLLFPVNLYIIWNSGNWKPDNFYVIFLYLQSLCYLFALLGWNFENKKSRSKFVFAPYYFVMINVASIRGIFRFMKGRNNFV